MARIMKELRIDSKGKRLEYSFIHNGMFHTFDSEEKAVKELMKFNNRKKINGGLMETKIKVKYGIGFVLYTFGLFWLSTINPKIFFSVGILTIGMLFLVEAYQTEGKHD